MPDYRPDLSTGVGWWASEIRTLPDAYGRSRRPRTSGPKTGRTPGNPLAPPISQAGAEQLAAQVGLADQQARQYLADLLRIRALRAQAELQALTAQTYKGGTGRLSRGIRVVSKVTSSETRLYGSIRLSLPRYRETRFLTNLGNTGQFFKLGLKDRILPYQIIAKGALRLFGRSSYKSTPLFIDPVRASRGARGSLKAGGTYIVGSEKRQQRMINDAVTGKKAVSYREMERRAVSYAEKYKGTNKIPRLKIPRGGYTTGIRRGGIFTLLRDMEDEEFDSLSVGRRRREQLIGRSSRGLIPHWDYAPGSKDNSQYRYPIWVVHPGFERDVIANYWQRTIYGLMQEMPQLAVKYVEAVERGGDIIRTSGVLQSGPKATKATPKQSAVPKDAEQFRTYIRSVTTALPPEQAWNQRFSRRYGYVMKP